MGRSETNTTSEPLQIKNKKKHLFDSLMEFRRGHTSISIMGLFFSGNIVTVGILKPGATTDENNQRESFCTTDLQEVRWLIIYIHDFLHGQTETIGYFCKINSHNNLFLLLLQLVREQENLINYQHQQRKCLQRMLKLKRDQ